MCTAICYRSNASYFGRNLDLDRGYGESVVIIPRNYEIKMRCAKPKKSHYAMIGMATIVDDFPLYYEATNEKGLSMVGLNFPQNAVYYPFEEGRDNIAPFELILWILERCACVDEAKALLGKINLININFSEQLPLSPLHWMISDQKCSLVVEPLKGGLKIYDNPFEVLTNNPPFEYHYTNASNYMGLSTGQATSQFGEGIPMGNYSLGLGALGLPGDYSSASRFIKALFVKENSVSEHTEKSNVNQFFHILNSVAMPKGCVQAAKGFEYTRYSSCCNLDKGIYYYTTYDELGIRAINMHGVDLNRSQLYTYNVKGL
ncbi:MAG: choloylglycine hydrolase family protein [Ruminococcaceae bacterium]|nr:choloylglycine hydrolase family protein [Oscillospiraceae bacterium]